MRIVGNVRLQRLGQLRPASARLWSPRADHLWASYLSSLPSNEFRPALTDSPTQATMPRHHLRADLTSARFLLKSAGNPIPQDSSDTRDLRLPLCTRDFARKTDWKRGTPHPRRARSLTSQVAYSDHSPCGATPEIGTHAPSRRLAYSSTHCPDGQAARQRSPPLQCPWWDERT